MCFRGNERAGKFVPSAASGVTLVILHVPKTGTRFHGHADFNRFKSNVLPGHAGRAARPGNFLAGGGYEPITAVLAKSPNFFRLGTPSARRSWRRRSRCCAWSALR